MGVIDTIWYMMQARGCDDPRHHAYTFGELFCYSMAGLLWLISAAVVVALIGLILWFVGKEIM